MIFQGLENGESVTFTAQAPMAQAAQGVTVCHHYPGKLLLLCRLWAWLLCDSTLYRVFWERDGDSLLYPAVKTGAGGAAHTRSQNWKETGNWQRCVITERKRPDRPISLTTTTPIFLPAKGLLLPIWQPPMPMEAKMPSMEPTVPGEALAKELYNYAVSQPDIPDVEMSFSNANVSAYVDGEQQRTEEITFKASSQQTIYSGSAGWGKTP